MEHNYCDIVAKIRKDLDYHNLKEQKGKQYTYNDYKSAMIKDCSKLSEKFYNNKPVEFYYKNKLKDSSLKYENYWENLFEEISKEAKGENCKYHKFFRYFRFLYHANYMLDIYHERFMIRAQMGYGYMKENVIEYIEKRKKSDMYNLHLTIDTRYSYKNYLEYLEYVIQNAVMIKIKISIKVIKDIDLNRNLMDIIKANIIKNKNLIVVHVHFTEDYDSFIEKLFNHIMLNMNKDIQFIVNKKNKIEGYKFDPYYKNNAVYCFKCINSKFVSFENNYDINFFYKDKLL